MRRFKHVLVVVAGDRGDRAAVERAVGLARANGARLRAVAAVDGPGVMPWRQSADEAARAEADLVAQLTGMLADMAADDLDVDVGGQIDRNPGTAVIHSVLAHGHDLVVLGGSEDPASKPPRWFGEVVRKAPVPVWVTRGHTHSDHIAIAVQLEAAGEPDPLDLALVEMGTTLARDDGAKVSVVHAWRVPGESMLRSPVGGDDQAEVDRMVVNEEARAVQRMQALLDRVDLAGLDVETRLLHGLPAVRLTRFVNRERVDLLVMGTVGRTGLASIVGNTADAVLRDSTQAILAVKPAGFETPVSPPD